MSFRSPRFRIAAALAFTVAFSGCGDDDPFAPQVIEDVTFAASLGIDLANFSVASTGLYLETIAEGVGEAATVMDAATVTFTGWLTDGSSFDSGTFTYAVGSGQVIIGFDRAVDGMKVGGIRRVIIPPGLGYGNLDRGEIPPGSILIFRIELDALS